MSSVPGLYVIKENSPFHVVFWSLCLCLCLVPVWGDFSVEGSSSHTTLVCIQLTKASQHIALFRFIQVLVECRLEKYVYLLQNLFILITVLYWLTFKNKSLIFFLIRFSSFQMSRTILCVCICRRLRLTVVIFLFALHWLCSVPLNPALLFLVAGSANKSLESTSLCCSYRCALLCLSFMWVLRVWI